MSKIGESQDKEQISFKKEDFECIKHPKLREILERLGKEESGPAGATTWHAEGGFSLSSLE